MTTAVQSLWGAFLCYNHKYGLLVIEWLSPPYCNSCHSFTDINQTWSLSASTC